MKANEELRQDIMQEIKLDPALRNPETEIRVAVKDGIVTLSGSVESYWNKLGAEKAAQRVAGVRMVISDIEVKLTASGTRTDTEVVEAVKNALRWNRGVRQAKIKVQVDNGWVCLDGSVDENMEKRYAQDCVENLPSVRGITNNIIVNKKPLNIVDIQRNHADPYHRSGRVDASSIRIDRPDARLPSAD